MSNDPNETPRRSILFVCTGNTCRSPMAAAILRKRLGPDSEWTVRSAGVSTPGGMLASPEVGVVLKEIDIELGDHVSSPVTEEALDEAAYIVCMTATHAAILLQFFPELAPRTRLMHSFGMGNPGKDVLDPVGGSLDVYRHTRDELDGAMADLILTLREDGELSSSSSPAPRDITQKTSMKVALGSDHGGFELKEKLVEKLKARGLQVDDVGTFSSESVDYPDIASDVAEKVSDGDVDSGILVCTTGIGMSITANKFPRVRAALCFSPHLARMSRTHNDANVLALPGNQISESDIDGIIDEWFQAEFEGGRHERRVNKIEQAMATHHEPIAVKSVDPEIYEVLMAESRRQHHNIELIASENCASAAVREANGSLLTNKYAEGYPGKRWYNGCEHVDTAETLAIERAKQIFGAEHANVQPHSGSGANMAVYFACLEPGDTILGMDLAHGGHLTHGMSLNFSGRLFNVVHYGVDKESERIDYDKLEEIATESKPKLILCGASAYPRILDFPRIRAIADKVGAMVMADIAHIAGLVAAGLHPNPVPHCEFVTTTTHKTLRGPRGGLIMCRKEFAKEVDKQIFPGTQGGPLMHTIAAKAVCFHEALKPEFKVYQQAVLDNAQALAAALADGGLRIVSGGTDNHLMLVDLNPIEVTGKDAATWLDEALITVNKNAIPFDDKSPFVTSGIRVGSPAVTTRGMGVPEMGKIADFIVRVLKAKGDESTIETVKSEVVALTEGFPVP